MAPKPETLAQAKRWQKVKNRYLEAGLCHRCAGQAAWGHQNGWRGIKPPCLHCAPIVATFEIPVLHSAWRCFAIADHEPRNGPHSHEGRILRGVTAGVGTNTRSPSQRPLKSSWAECTYANEFDWDAWGRDNPERVTHKEHWKAPETSPGTLSRAAG